MGTLDELAGLYGIQHDYHDYKGEHRLVSGETKRGLLAAMGVPVRDEGEMAAAVLRKHEQRWRETLPPVFVQQQGQAAALELSVEARLWGSTPGWSLTLENGEQRLGQLTLDDEGILERGCVDGIDRLRYHVHLPPDLPTGYHTLELAGQDETLRGSTRLIVVPARCYQPSALGDGARRWGLAVQLYTLVAAQGWGMGDFGELASVVRLAAGSGADFIGLNPLHALYPANPDHCSPYGPSSRAFLNILYVDATQVPEYAECESARALVASDGFRARVARARDATHVDYSTVSALKFPVLRKLYRHFRERHIERNTQRAQDFEGFVEAGGGGLRTQALYDALYEHFRTRDTNVGSWRQWPRDYHDPDGESVRRFAAEQSETLQFYQYLQFLADEQLGAAQAAAEEAGMLIGLYRDVAVGVDSAGAEAWANQSLYCLGASVGAPPDPLALQGQDWGLPPQNPDALRARGYEDFALLLRANMRHCGALRMDHVMALMRLWWVPQGQGADAGAYVSYPLRDLLGLLALESQRNRCLVIGEDLGTVPDEIRAVLSDAGVYSYRVLYFEKRADGNFKAPHEYPREALATVTTHDLPPLHGYWEGHDLVLRDELDLFPTAEIRGVSYRERENDRAALLRALADSDLLPPDGSIDPDHYRELPWSLAAAIQVYLARSNAALMAVQPEDWLEMRDPVNVPGTSTEYRNWSRRLGTSIEALLQRPAVRELAQRIGRARGR